MTKLTLTPVVPGVQAVINDVARPVASNVRGYPLANVHSNPWQTRLAEDHAHIRNLADSIATKSMLQVPLARPYPGKPGHIQLAFGHSRFAAYQLLADPTVVVEEKERFFYFPVDVREMSDREMSDLAAEENAKRNDLTAIEKATAIQRRMKDFGLTQEEAGAPFGYKTQGAVSNLLGLLRLPDALRESVATGEIPQRLARQAVIVGQLFPKEVTAAMREAAKAPVHEREQATHDALSQVLDRKGRSIRDAAFKPDWPEHSIPLNGQAVGDLTELPPCVGCEFFYKRDDETFCLRPACYDLKHERALEEQLKKASLKTGAPILAKGEKALQIFEGFYWNESQQMKKLLSAFKRDASLGLGLRVAPKPERVYGHYGEVTGSDHVIVMTLNKPACEKFLKEVESKKEKPKAKGAFNLPPLPPAQAAAHAAAEEAAKEERRQERSGKYRLEADVVWLVKNFVLIAAEQITINGAVLAYVVERLLRSNRQKASEFYGLLDWYDMMEGLAQSSTGKEADLQRRMLLVASQVFEHVLPWNGSAHEGCWDEVAQNLTELAAVGSGEDIGLGVKLPSNWNKPPIHHTDHNCWFCGKFASSRTLTKRDIEAGWWVAPAKAKDAIPPVACPDCAADAIKTLEAPKATKKAK